MAGKPTVVIISLVTDEHVVHLLPYLEKNAVVYFIKLDSLANHKLVISDYGKNLLVDGQHIACEELTSLWLRRNIDIPDPEKEPAKILQVRESQALSRSLRSFPAKRKVSDQWSIKASEDKLHCLRIAQSCGWKVPDSIITNNPEVLLAFWKKYDGKICTKTMSVPVILSKNEKAKVFYTSLLDYKDIEERAALAGTIPMLFQQYIEKAYEVRSTVVGKQVYSAAIYSQKSDLTKTDWRNYDFPNVPHFPINLPPEVEQRLLSTIKRLGLNFAACDLIVTPDNEYVFLEANPVGQWLWIEQLCGLPISEALCSLLCFNSAPLIEEK
ncbi:MAG: hypothetical protein AAB074_18335 [Planctomycetota bacterium]